MKRFNYLVIATLFFGVSLSSCDKDKDKNEEFTVTFNSNGGSTALPQTVKKGEKVVKPENPTRDEYGFVAWYKDKELTNEWKFDTDVVTVNITLYAKWQLGVYTVSFNSNGGSAVLPQSVNSWYNATKPDDPTRNGYIFVGWYSDEELKNRWFFDARNIVFSDITLYAKWSTADPLFKIDGLTIDNYPIVDGSTSNMPLNTLIACKLLDIGCDWASTYGMWNIEPNLNNNNSEKFWARVKSSQTHQSFINLIDNNADLTLSARTMSPDEKEHADAAGVTLIETPIALDAFIFVVNPNNPIKSLTIKQIQDIYTGKITNWSEVGGNNVKINPYVRNANSGSQELMESLVMKDLDFMEFPVSPEVINSMTGVFDRVSTDVSAICYSVYYYKEMILRGTHTKTIAIEGIYPDKETISNISYPLVAEVYAIIRSDLDKSSMAYKLYELLQTQDGKRVIAESGYVPN